MHSLCVLLTFSNGGGTLLYILHTPVSLSKDLCGLFCSSNMVVKVYLFLVLMCLSTIGTSVWGLYFSSFAFTWEFFHLDEISPGNSFVVEFGQEAGPSRRGGWRPPLQNPRPHTEELKGLSEAPLWLLETLTCSWHPCHLHSSLTIIILAFIFMLWGLNHLTPVDFWLNYSHWH